MLLASHKSDNSDICVVSVGPVFFWANYRQNSTFFQTLSTNAKGKKGVFHLKSPKTDGALCFGGGWHHIYVYRLQLSEFLEMICLNLPRDARDPAPSGN
jgi:hypothetical protein